MKDATISTRLLILLGTLCLLLIAVGGLGLYGTSSANAAFRAVYDDRIVPLGQLSEINRLYQRNRILAMDMAMFPQADNVGKRSTEIVDNVAKVSKLWAEYLATTLTPEEKVLAERILKCACSL